MNNNNKHSISFKAMHHCVFTTKPYITFSSLKERKKVNNRIKQSNE